METMASRICQCGHSSGEHVDHGAYFGKCMSCACQIYNIKIKIPDVRYKAPPEIPMELLNGRMDEFNHSGRGPVDRDRQDNL